MNQQLVNMLWGPKKRNQQMTFKEAVNLLWDMNLLNTGEMAERALVKKSKGNLKQNTRNKKSSDFHDNSEHKYSTVQYRGQSGRAQIVGLKHKTGLLRVMVHEPKTGLNYFFRVPYRVYKNVVSPKVYFDGHGNPKSPTRKGCNFDMWEYNCTAKEWAAK